MNREQFYKSKRWEAFRQVIIDERTDEDGYVKCAVCEKPILKKYDLIVHHKKELDDINVNDVMISLNPDNVECVHFKCHNKIHERFGYGNSGYRPSQKRVYIVYGSPCAGKTTWVNEVATKDDLIVDMDSLWQMISINDRYDKPSSLKSVVFEVRDKMYDIIKYRSGKWHNAYVITGGAMAGDRQRLKQRINADELVFIDTSKDECLSRVQAKHKNKDICILWEKYIDEWFERYQS